MKWVKWSVPLPPGPIMKSMPLGVFLLVLLPPTPWNALECFSTCPRLILANPLLISTTQYYKMVAPYVLCWWYFLARHPEKVGGIPMHHERSMYTLECPYPLCSVPFNIALKTFRHVLLVILIYMCISMGCFVDVGRHQKGSGAFHTLPALGDANVE